MKRRIFALFLTLALLAGLCPLSVLAAAGEGTTEKELELLAATGDWCTVEGIEGGQICFDSDTGTITDCETSVTKADIPATINGVSVTSIGDWAFYGCSSLTSISIPSSVTSIGNGAFSGCSLTSISIPASVTSIGDSAFSGCTSLTSISIPDSVTSIGDWAFRSCTSLTSITIPSSVTSIGYEEFYNCSSLTSISIPSSVTSIGDYAFSCCRSLTSISIPGSVTSIGDYAFSCCRSLTSISIPASVTSIGYYAFSGCSSLTSISIPSSVTSIGNYAFSGCSSLTSISIPSSVTSIGGSAFSGCSSLTSISIPGSVTSIGDDAFSGCSSLTSISIPDSVTSIGNCAFHYCTSLTSISIPGNVTSIGNCAFDDCRSLTSISVADGNSEYSSSDGILFNKTKTTLIAYPGGKSETSYTIPISVTSIGDYAFSCCRSLTSISSVTSIGNGAFSGCSGLTSISIPSSVTSIGNYAFKDCTSLTSISIPSSVTSIGNYVFKDCTSLTSISIPGSVTSIGNWAFHHCTSLTSISIPGSVTSIGEYAFFYCTSLTSISIPGSVTSIGKYAFCYCTSLTSISIPSSVTSILYGAFDDCSNLTSISIPISVTRIKDWAFEHCSRLKDVYYSGSAEQWSKISIGCYNKCLTSATIHYNSCGIPVYTDDSASVAAAALPALRSNTLFQNISINSGELKGPEITFGSKTFNLFSIKSNVKLNLGDTVSIQSKVDTEKKTVQILLGYKAIDGSTLIQGDPNSIEEETDFYKSYTDAKSLYQMTKKGSGANSKAFRSKFQDQYDKMQEFGMDMLVTASGRVSGYLEFSYETGNMVFSEGGAILGVEIAKTVSGRIPNFPAAYVSFRIECSVDGKFYLVAEEDSSVRFEVSLDGALGASAAVGLGDNSGKFQAYIEGGLKGELGCHIPGTSKEESGGGGVRDSASSGGPLSVDLSGEVYFTAKSKVWLLEVGNTWKKTLFKFGLYPKLELLGDNPFESLTMEDFTKPVTRDYLTGKLLLMGAKDDYSYYNEDYPYAEPSLFTLSDGRLLMVWVGDTGEKEVWNRTSIRYSIYENGSWGEPTTIAENGSYNDHPVLVQDGETLHLVWMRADTTIEDSWDLAAVLQHIELCFSTFEEETGRWTEPTVISDPENTLAETDYAIGAKDGAVTVAWLENDENDIMMNGGTNTIFCRTLQNGTWGEIETVYTTEDQITGLTAAQEDSGYQITYSVYGNETTTTYQRQEGETSSVMENTDQSVKQIGGHIYDLRDGELYRDNIATGLQGLTNFELLTSGSKTAVLTLISTGFTCELFASYYDAASETWEDWRQISNYGMYIRSYSAVLDKDGKIAAALNLVPVDTEAEQIYDNTSAVLAVADDMTYADLVLSDWITYEDEAVTPGGILPLSFAVTNNSRETLSSLTVHLRDEAGEILKTEAVSCSVLPGETQTVTVDYTLPEPLSKHTVTVEIETDELDEKSNTENNSASIEIGEADLTVTASAPQVDKTGASVALTVRNTGFESAETPTLTVYDANRSGEALREISLGTVAPQEEKTVSLSLPESYLFLEDAETMYALNFEVTSDTEERDLANNSDRIAFGNLMPWQVTGTRSADGTVTVTASLNAGETEKQLFVALYNGEGKILQVKQAALETTATLTFSCENETEELTAKAFLLEGNQPYSPARTITLDTSLG